MKSNMEKERRRKKIACTHNRIHINNTDSAKPTTQTSHATNGNTKKNHFFFSERTHLTKSREKNKLCILWITTTIRMALLRTYCVTYNQEYNVPLYIMSHMYICTLKYTDLSIKYNKVLVLVNGPRQASKLASELTTTFIRMRIL